MKMRIRDFLMEPSIRSHLTTTRRNFEDGIPLPFEVEVLSKPVIFNLTHMTIFVGFLSSLT